MIATSEGTSCSTGKGEAQDTSLPFLFSRRPRSRRSLEPSRADSDSHRYHLDSGALQFQHLGCEKHRTLLCAQAAICISLFWFIGSLGNLSQEFLSTSSWRRSHRLFASAIATDLESQYKSLSQGSLFSFRPKHKSRVTSL